MSKILDLVLLIDDNEDDNFFNRRRLEKSGLVREIKDFMRAEEALGYLRRPNRPNADLILLDINMPGMDGFHFADEYQKLYPELKAETMLIMVSASLNPKDRMRAGEHPSIDGFVSKPPSIDQLEPFLHKPGQSD